MFIGFILLLFALVSGTFVVVHYMVNSAVSKLRYQILDVVQQKEHTPIVKFFTIDKSIGSPIKAHLTDAGYDLFVRHFEILSNGEQIRYYLNTKMALPLGYVGLIFPRSSISKYGIRLSNAVGVIDAEYRGEMMAVCDSISQSKPSYNISDRAFQLVIIKLPLLNVHYVDDELLLGVTERGEGGYGSTGV
jgi:dUTP pyrophosphatase